MTTTTDRIAPSSAPSADEARILMARGLRQFAYGLLAVVLAVALARDGISPAAIGALITVSLVGDFCGTYLISLHADRWGRRRTLVGLALLMAATGAVFGLTRFFPVLLVAAFFGTLGTSGSETAPFLPIEQAILPQTTPAEGRTAAFARYNLVAALAGALGSLCAGLPDLLVRWGLAASTGINLMFGVYTTVALLAALNAARLSSAVEAPAATLCTTTARRRFLPPLGKSHGIVIRLAGLFSVDAFAGGLTVQSLLALFFHLRFGASLATLGLLFFGANLLTAVSFLAAVPLARRFGLLNTMVFSHLPSNVLLAAVALMPTFPLAGGIFLVRQVLSQMDVPTRQAYTMALVAPEERTAAAGVTSLARSAGSAASPVLSGLLLQGPLMALGIPFLAAGALKVAYDLTLWRIFRGVRPPDETHK